MTTIHVLGSKAALAAELGVSLTGDWRKDAMTCLDGIERTLDDIADKTGHPRFEVFTAQNGIDVTMLTL